MGFKQADVTFPKRKRADEEKYKFKGPEPLLSRQGEGAARKRTYLEKIMIEVKVRLAEGKTLAAIKEETGLGRRERQVLDVYMESQGRLGHRDIAEKLDLHISNVGSIVVELKRKIIGGRAT